jgi:hypothetical protein
MRPEVLHFAELMDKELTANENKGNWKSLKSRIDILYEFEYHKAKLMFALKLGMEDDIKEHSADCANYLLMLLVAEELICTSPPSLLVS